MSQKFKHFDTLAVHAGDRKRTPGGTPVTTPIHSATSFFHDTVQELGQVFDEQLPGHTYTRYGNPTSRAFEEQVAALENADVAASTASGMAATHLAIMAGLVDRRRKIVAGDVLYGQTISMLMSVFESMGVETRFAAPCDLERFEAVVAETQPGCVVVETVTNPLLRVTPIARVAEIAHRHGALLIVDATFTTPVMSRTLEQGADIVVHSATKYMAGHGDVLGGIVLAKQELAHPLKYLSRTLGGCLGPFEAYLAMRGVKTLPLRFERQCANAAAVAQALVEHDAVERVYYPGLASHPDHELARQQFGDRFGAVVSFDIKGGKERALELMNSLRMIVPATSVGDVHSMILYPPMSTHRDLSPKHRERIGIGDGLLRLSVGIEAVDDIVGDLRQALEPVKA